MGCIRDRVTPLLTFAFITTVNLACDGTLSDPSGASVTPRPKPAPGVGSEAPAQPGEPSQPADPSQPGLPSDPATPPEPTEPSEPSEPGLPVVDPFASATVGARCVSGAAGRFLVLSGPDGRCAAHAAAFDSPSAPAPFVYAALPASVPVGTDLELDATACLSAGACGPRRLTVRFEAYAEGELARGRWSMPLEGAQGEGSFSASWCDYASDQGADLSEAAIIDEVALYQAVRVPLARAGQLLGARNAPIVEDREALVRVFVSPRPGVAAQSVVARLTLESLTRGPVVLEETLTVTRVSAETAADSTFNFLIPRETLKQDTQFSVSLHPAASACGSGGQPAGARVPSTGLAALGAQSSGPSFEVVLVPVRYDADGSGRLPDTSAAQLTRYRDRIYSLFPTANVNITVRPVVGWSGALQRNGSGWANLLQALQNLRAQDQAAAHVFYYGIFAPAASFREFCNGGCVSGLGSVPSANDSYSRGAIGLGFSGSSSADTAAHELGHTLGRLHAPCGTQDADPQFPYANGGIGVWGFDVLSNTLRAPTQSTDFMGYCDPNWVSDYNFTALFNRISHVNRNRGAQSLGVAESYRVAITDLDGLRWGEPVVLNRAPEGETVSVKRVAADGRVSQYELVRYALADLEGAFYMVPEALAAPGARLELPEGALDL